MTENARRDTARIYQFPAKPRAMARSSTTGAIADRQAIRAPMADFGSGWYHDAAIQKDLSAPHAG